MALTWTLPADPLLQHFALPCPASPFRSRGYGSNEFREDLKKLYQTAGIAGEPVVFLFSDTQVRRGASASSLTE